MHYREANVNFLLLQQGMEGLEQGVAAPCPLFILPFFSLQQQEENIKLLPVKYVQTWQPNHPQSVYLNFW